MRSGYMNRVIAMSLLIGHVTFDAPIMTRLIGHAKSFSLMSSKLMLAAPALIFTISFDGPGVCPKVVRMMEKERKASTSDESALSNSSLQCNFDSCVASPRRPRPKQTQTERMTHGTSA